MMQARQPAGAGLAIAGDRKPAGAHGQQLDHQQAHPEAGHAGPQHGQGADALVYPAAAPDCRGDAAGHADEHGQADRKNRQPGRRFCPVQQHLRDGHLQKDRLPQIALEHLAQPQHKLREQRLVQPVALTG